jgi:pimeloyl-ACP methyl ester carboxylesterase
LQELVNYYQCILVLWDGCMDGKEPDPYNIGNPADVKFQVQMKDYFPELIAYIDATYRTIADRDHRGIIGFSMGGFMSLFLAGKYPDRVCADVSLAGSAELYVGYPDNQTLYSIRYTFANLADVDLRIHNGNTDILYYLNEEVHAGAVWEGKDLQYWVFPGGHMVDSPGQIRVFGKAMRFVSDAFRVKHLPAKSWSHYDLYPDFSIWGYHVASNKNEPGFLYLKNVSRKGFGWGTYRWLPDGTPLRSVRANVTTAPVYVPAKEYGVARYRDAGGAVSVSKTSSDVRGRLHFEVEGSGEQLGIFTERDGPDLVFLDYTAGRGNYLPAGRPGGLVLRLFNRGGEGGLSRPIRIRLGTTDTSVHITNPEQTVEVKTGERILRLPPFDVTCFKMAPPHAEPASIKFYLSVTAGKDSSRDEFSVPVWFDVPGFDSIRIDDGRMIRDSILGSGNGDGMINPGERVLVYTGMHRLRLYTNDPWVVRDKERLAYEIIPARWPDGVDLSTIIEIAADCPDGHVIECFGSYETKTFNPIERKLSWGKFRLTVHRKKSSA